jgi:hypothetical protein
MKLNYYLFSLCCIAILGLTFESCNKEGQTEWDTDILSPIIETEFSVSDLIVDSLIISPQGEPLVIRYEKSFRLIPDDSLLRIPDTLLGNSISLPVTLGLPAGFQVANISQLIKFGYRDVQLTEAVLESGYAEFKVSNSLEDKVILDYSFPKLTKNGQAVIFTNQVVESGSIGNPTVMTRTIDLSQHHLDLRGDNNINSNQLRFLLDATLNPSGIGAAVYSNVPFVNYENKFVNLKPSFARGYLGNTSFSFEESTAIEFMNKFSGLIELADLKLDLNLENSVGADFILNIDEISSSRNNTVMTLQHAIIGSNQTISRAQNYAHLNQPYSPTYRNFSFTTSNSNLKSMIELLPYQLNYKIRAEINPLGNVSSGNDFVYSSSNIKLNMTLEMPLRFSASAFTYIDTIKINGIESNTTDPFQKGEFRLVAQNGFPMNMLVQLILLDENKQFLDTLTSNQPIEAASVNDILRVESPRSSSISFQVNEKIKSSLSAARYISIKSRFDTKPEQELLPMYSDYKLKLQLIGDGTYRIRLR